VLFAAYTDDLETSSPIGTPTSQASAPTFDLSNPYVVVGLLLRRPAALPVRRHGA
jgi:Na+/H+-translocating membrane pyrophosphatase